LSDGITRDQLHYLFAEMESGDPESAEYRRCLTNTFVNAIYLRTKKLPLSITTVAVRNGLP